MVRVMTTRFLPGDAILSALFIGMYVVLFFSSAYVLARSRKRLVHGWVIRSALVLM